MTPAFFAWCLLLQSLTPEVIEHARAGAEARQEGHLDAAIAEFRKVTELQPRSAVGHADLGDAYFQKGDYTAAIPELESALRLNPDLMITHQTLGVVLLMLGNAEGALPHLEKMHTPEVLGLAWLETGRLDGAITALHAALQKQPDDSNLLYYLGRGLALASKRAQQQVLKVDPGLVSSAAPADDKSQPQDVFAIQEALAHQPDNPRLLLAFSRAAALASGKTFDEILRLDAHSARAHQVLAERYFENGRLRDAEREYVECLQLKPNTAHLHSALGDVLAAERNQPAALAQYQMETMLQPLSGDAAYSLGAALLRHGDVKAAVSELNKADQLKPGAPHILLALGGAAFDIHDDALAEASWTKLLGIDKDGEIAARAHLGLSKLYRRAGKAADADREQGDYARLTNTGGPAK